MKVGDLVKPINQPCDDFIPAHWRGIIIAWEEVHYELPRNLIGSTPRRRAIVFWNREYHDEREICEQIEVVNEAR